MILFIDTKVSIYKCHAKNFNSKSYSYYTLKLLILEFFRSFGYLKRRGAREEHRESAIYFQEKLMHTLILFFWNSIHSPTSKYERVYELFHKCLLWIDFNSYMYQTQTKRCFYEYRFLIVNY